jgi:hypothetical protein
MRQLLRSWYGGKYVSARSRLHCSSASFSRQHDYRTRSDRVQRHVDSWREQMNVLVNAYLRWAANGPPTENTSDAEEWEFTVISFEGRYSFHCMNYMRYNSCCTEHQTHRFCHPASAQYVNETLALYGILGATPVYPTCGFPFKFLEIFRQLHRVQPRLSISAVATTIHHIHQVRYSIYGSEMF